MTKNEAAKKVSAAARRAQRAIDKYRNGVTGATRDGMLRAIESAERAYDRARAYLESVAECEALWAETCEGLRSQIAVAEAHASAYRREMNEARAAALAPKRDDDVRYVPGVGYCKGRTVIG